MSLVWWSLDSAALQGLFGSQRRERGHGKPNHPRSPSATLLLLETAQLVVTANREVLYRVSLPELQSSGPVPHFDVAAPTPDHRSCSVSIKKSIAL